MENRISYESRFDSYLDSFEKAAIALFSDFYTISSGSQFLNTIHDGIEFFTLSQKQLVGQLDRPVIHSTHDGKVSVIGLFLAPVCQRVIDALPETDVLEAAEPVERRVAVVGRDSTLVKPFLENTFIDTSEAGWVEEEGINIVSQLIGPMRRVHDVDAVDRV
jgi:hypothetical protein